MREQTFQCLLKPHSFPLSWRDKKGAPGGIPGRRFRQGFRQTKPSPMCRNRPPAALCKIVLGTGGRRLTKPRKWGIVKTQRVLPVGRLPLHHREVTVILEEWRLLLFAILENQTNDSQNDHAELKQFTP